jgi:hypothetical protein
MAGKAEEVIMARHRKSRYEELPQTANQLVGTIAGMLKHNIDHEEYLKHPEKFFGLFTKVWWYKQAEMIVSVLLNKITLVRSCNSVGKTFAIAVIVWYWLYIYRPDGENTKTKVITTAKNFNSTQFMLWTRIRELYKHVADRFGFAHINMVDFQPDPEKYPEWFAIGLNPKIEGEEATAFQGHHGQHTLFIIDEAITTPPAIFRAIEGSLLDEGSRLLCTYNPTTTVGSEVYQMEQDHGGNLITISCWDLFDSPEYKANPKAFNELVTPEGARKLIKKYGRNHPVVKARLDGDWPLQDEEAAINYEGLQLSFKRYKKESYKIGVIQKIVYGWDVAGEGSDTNVMYRALVGDSRYNYETDDEKEIEPRPIMIIEKMDQWNAKHTTSLAKVIAKLQKDKRWADKQNKKFYKELGKKDQEPPDISISLFPDAIGEGSHVASFISEADGCEFINVMPFKAGNKSEGVDEREEITIMNNISEAWYRTSLALSELVDEWPIILTEKCRELENELKDRKYFFQLKLKEPQVWFIEPKGDYKARNRGNSPDHADAYVQTVFGYFYEDMLMPRVDGI